MSFQVRHYCHRCAVRRGLSVTAKTENLFDTPYQWGKIAKHTTLGNYPGTVSIFANQGTASYRDYVVNTAGSGWVEVDQWERTNLIWLAGTTTGTIYVGNQFLMPADGVKLVLYGNELKIHAYPSRVIPSTVCSDCGSPIPYEP